MIGQLCDGRKIFKRSKNAAYSLASSCINKPEEKENERKKKRECRI
jgi:hypothetical protein